MDRRKDKAGFVRRMVLYGNIENTVDMHGEIHHSFYLSLTVRTGDFSQSRVLYFSSINQQTKIGLAGRFSSPEKQRAKINL